MQRIPADRYNTEKNPVVFNSRTFVYSFQTAILKTVPTYRKTGYLF